MSIIVTVSLHMPVSADDLLTGFFCSHGKSSERQGGILGTFVNFLRNTKGSGMSDSGSDSGSSSDDLVPSQHPSVQEQDKNQDKQINDAEDTKEQKEESGAN